MAAGAGAVRLLGPQQLPSLADRVAAAREPVVTARLGGETLQARHDGATIAAPRNPLSSHGDPLAAVTDADPIDEPEARRPVAPQTPSPEHAQTDSASADSPANAQARQDGAAIAAPRDPLSSHGDPLAAVTDADPFDELVERASIQVPDPQPSQPAHAHSDSASADSRKDSARQLGGDCRNTCQYSYDGYCDDGGPGS
eukprot:3849195-Prymnesium_polylepis.1